MYQHRPTDTTCAVCAKEAYRLADVPLGSRHVEVPLCAECFLLFSSFPSAFRLAQLVGLDRDRPRLAPVPRG